MRIFLIIIITFLTIDAKNTNVKDIQSLLTEDSLCFKNRHKETCIKSYLEALKIKQNDGFFYAVRGLNHWTLGKYEKTIEDLDTAITLGCDDSNIYCHIGLAYLNLKKPKYKEAIKNFDKALLGNPKNIKARYHRGLSYLALGQHEDSIVQDMTSVLDINSCDCNARKIRACANLLDNQSNEVIKDCKIMIAHHSSTYCHNVYHCYTYLGKVFKDQNKYRQSIKYYEKSIKYNKVLNIKSNNKCKISSNIFFGLGHAYYLHDQPYMSIQYYLKGISHEKDIFNISDYIKTFYEKK